MSIASRSAAVLSQKLGSDIVTQMGIGLNCAEWFIGSASVQASSPITAAAIRDAGGSGPLGPWVARVERGVYGELAEWLIALT